MKKSQGQSQSKIAVHARYQEEMKPQNMDTHVKWAATWRNQQSECAPSKDSDQPGHLPSLITVFACAQWVAKDLSFLHADSEDSDQTGRMPRLICVFAGRTLTLLVLSCRGSNDKRTLLLCHQQKRCHFPWYQLFSPPPWTLSSSPVSLVSLLSSADCHLRGWNKILAKLLNYYSYYYYFFSWVLGPVNITSFILSRVNRKVGRKQEIPEQNHLTTRKKNLTCLTCDTS